MSGCKKSGGGVKSCNLMSKNDFVPPLFNTGTQGVKSCETVRNVCMPSSQNNQENGSN